MITKIPNEIISLYNKVLESGYECFFVGGCVRNMLLSREPKDWDLTTNATPEQVLKIFPDGFYDNQFGTVGVPINTKGVTRVEGLPGARTETELKEHSREGNERQDPEETESQIVEITTFRTERDYKDGRHPTNITWGKTIEEDLERRDFTMNAIALKINQGVTGVDDPASYKLIDPFNGQLDLKQNIIRAVGNPNKRFKEDALRLMRAIRFATQLGFTIEKETWEAIKIDAILLPLISGERIRDELLKILSSSFPYDGIMLLKNANLLQYILPELLEGIKLSQSRPGRHHVFDVFTHNVLSLKFCPSQDPIVRFATLIHDVGKSRVVGKDENGLVIFYNHEIAGSKLAYDICNRLHFSKKETKKITMLIRWHMFSVDEHITDSAVRRFIRRVGVENVKDMIDLRIGDRLGSGIAEEKAESWRLKKFKERIEDQLKPAPFSINDLAIDGNEIMKTLVIKPGPIIGKLLQQLFEEVDEDLSLNNKDYLIKRLKEIKI